MDKTLPAKGSPTNSGTNEPIIKDAVLKEAKWIPDGFLISGNVVGTNLNISTEAVRTLNLTSSSGQVIKINTSPVNTYSTLSTNYSGFEAIFGKTQLKDAVKGETYKMSLEFYYNGEVRNIQLLNPDNITVGHGSLGFQVTTEDGIEVLIEDATNSIK